MNDKNKSVGSGLSKPELVLEFWAFRSRFLGYIRRHVSNGCADDVFQEACLRFLASQAVFIHPQPATSYFCQILRSLIADHFERGRRLEYRESVPEESWDPWPEQEERHLAERVCEASRRLPAKDRRSLAAYFGPDIAGSGPGLSREICATGCATPSASCERWWGKKTDARRIAREPNSGSPLSWQP